MKLDIPAASRSPWYWLALALFSLALEGVALYYQYALGEPPCRLCVHVRLWVAALLPLSLLGLAVRGLRWPNAIAHVLTLGIGAALAERSYQLLGTERGFLFGDCGMDLGLPAWLPLDKWLPALFRAEVPCGYTPKLWFGVTMAEALMAVSVIMLLLALGMGIAAALGNDIRDQ